MACVTNNGMVVSDQAAAGGAMGERRLACGVLSVLLVSGLIGVVSPHSH